MSRSRRMRRARRVRRVVRGLFVGGLALGIVAACGSGARVDEPSAPSTAPSATVSATLALTRTQVLAALGAAQVQAQDARVPFRPGESASVAAAPRVVLQALLPEAPQRGFIVLYELADPGAATAAAQELASYIASGPGRVQFPNDARFTIRQLGAALVFYHYSPAASEDPLGEERLATALASLGQGWEVPR
jgi:hypothetical protein